MRSTNPWPGLSPVLHADVARYESVRRFQRNLSDRAVTQHASYIADAISAGEIRDLHPRLLAAVLRQVAHLLTDQEAVGRLGLTSEQAQADVDVMMWEGLIPRA